MFDIYIISFNLLWETLYPPILRLPNHLDWGKVLMKPLQYLRDLIFEDYANGSLYDMYDNITNYIVGDRVIYIDRGSYECIQDTIGNIPTNTSYWRKINDNYIGIRERIKYNSQKILFEWALNRNFICTGIYISNTPLTTTGFLMGHTGPYSSTLAGSSNVSANPSYLANSLTLSDGFSYTIYVPIAVFNALGTSNGQRESIIRAFADKYNLAGMFYKVVTY